MRGGIRKAEEKRILKKEEKEKQGDPEDECLTPDLVEGSSLAELALEVM